MTPPEPTPEFTPSGFDFEFPAPADYARLYRLRGIQVVPAFTPTEHKSWKRPLLDSWKDFQEALVSDEVFASWYGADGKYAARSNMGVITGRASNNIFVIDLDHHKNAQAATWWNSLMLIHNNTMDLETVEQRTGGGGSQKLYRAPPEWVAPTSKTPIGVDIRGQGGFAMLAPSLHESGRHYEWCDGKSPDDIPVTMAPDWLLEAVEALVAEHGGGVSAPRKTNGQGPQGIYDGFGSQIDGREEYMRDLIWGAVVDWHRECPIKPSDRESLRKAVEKYNIYERHVSPQQDHPPDLDKASQLDAEGRGPRLFRVKWDAAMRHWDDKVAVEAKSRPPPKPEGGLDLPEQKVDPATGKPVPLILTSAEFLAGYTPPAYLIDGVIQRGYLYSLTARTGHGKTAIALYMAQAIARGVDMHGCPVLPGTVLILAGENPDDVRARFLVLGKAYDFDPAASKIRWIPGVKHLPSHMDIIRREVETIDDLVLVLVDTAAAYFPGTETNSNSEQGSYARLLRELTFLKGKPAAIALSHPVKNAARDNLLPMGGSAFLNEVDGNLTLWSGNERQTMLHWQGKFRGPEFDPMVFELVPEYCDTVKDEKGRALPSVVAKPMSNEDVEASEDMAEKDEDRLMRAMHGSSKASFSKLAEIVGWKKWKVQRIMDQLLYDRLVEKKRRGKYSLTEKGDDAIGALKRGRHD